MSKWRGSGHAGDGLVDVKTLRERGIDTLPKFLLWDYEKYGNTKVSMREKDYGVWNRYTWADCYQHIKHFALGLVSLGLKERERVCIIGDNKPEWFWAEVATQAMRGIAGGLYVDVTPPELEYFITHSESQFAVASDQEQIDKFLEIKHKTPSLEKVIYWDTKGMWSYKDDPFLIEFKDVEELGKEYEKDHPGCFEESINKGSGNDIALLLYTSGTTGALPKGAMISHECLIQTQLREYPFIPIYSDDEYLSYVSPAWLAEQTLGVLNWLLAGMVVNFVESPETIMENMREIGPHLTMLGTRQWESLLSMVQAKINDASALERLTYNLCMPIGYRVADYRLKEKTQPPLLWMVIYRIANWLCFRPVRDQLGLARARNAITGGALLGPDTFRFFLAIGVTLKSMYGLTEVTGICGHYDDVRPDSLGPPMLGATVRISDEGELLVRGNPIFEGYFKAPERTAEVIDNGFVKSGDAGFVDNGDGHVIMLDRVKEMVGLKGGGKYSSAYIENSLKFSPYIRDAMVVGGNMRDYIIAILIIDFDNVGKWAERNRIPYTTFADLSQKAEVYDLVLKDMKRVNGALPPAAQLKKFTLLYKEFDPDEGELTRTRKLRRKVLEDRYSSLIEAAYNNETKLLVETEVKYQDGRRGKITTPVYIRTIE